ncbi:MAG TPA: hypothetical protein DEF48_21675 [Nostoc sp. UBA8866]|uniref:Uncharacterized protein n=1 Tax=Trichormus variabilis NIES-23 TaxID=1973479 RepID=A0A1Z4KHQ7_ANAVA|nr:hypothetical protein NIES23_12940 [Trichormus variabilis NIES-23]HBW32631.1 hypothetical protein [Nostoc sp. UBA8866]
MLLLILILPPDVKENLDHPLKLATSAVLRTWPWILRWSANISPSLLSLFPAISTKTYYLLRWLNPETNGNFFSKSPYSYAKSNKHCRFVST